MEFWKINGNGNDFITFDMLAAQKTTHELEELARRLCRRRASIGADGLLIAEPSASVHFRMRLFNADGSEAEMCGNGARCIARFAYERRIAPAEMTFETLAGVVSANVSGSFVKIDLGEQSFVPGWIDRSLMMDGVAFRSCFLRVGVPHLTLFTAEELSYNDCRRIGCTFRRDTSLFPQGCNVNFAHPIGHGELAVATYERGVEDLTDSCGTGSVAAALSANLLFGMDSPIEVHNRGGINRVGFERLDEMRFRATLSGNTAVVAKGELGPDA